MDIVDFANQAFEKLQLELNELAKERENKLIQFESAFHLVDCALEKVKSYLGNYEFKSEEEEINFFKNHMTEFLKESVFYSELFNMESIKPPGPKKEIKRFYERELASIRDFLQSHQNLYNYLLLKKVNQDTVFFLRSSQVPVYKPSLFWHTLDTRFCTVYTLYFARIKGSLAFSDYIHEQLNLLNGSEGLTAQVKKYPLVWTGKKVDMVELVYALKAGGVFNHGRADIKEIATVLELLFNSSLKDIYRTYQEISLRKKSRTAFLDYLSERLTGYLEQGESLN